MKEKDTVSVQEAASILEVSRSHIYRLIKRGQLTLIRNPLYDKHGPVKISRSQVESLRQPK